LFERGELCWENPPQRGGKWGGSKKKKATKRLWVGPLLVFETGVVSGGRWEAPPLWGGVVVKGGGNKGNSCLGRTDCLVGNEMPGPEGKEGECGEGKTLMGGSCRKGEGLW